MINADKPHLWKQDVITSIETYNDWFLQAAPLTWRGERSSAIEAAMETLLLTQDLTDVTASVLKSHPEAMATWRMCTAPPLARDRLVGLSGVPRALVHSLEAGKLPARMTGRDLEAHLKRLCEVIAHLIDRDLFHWLDAGALPTPQDRDVATAVVGDRLCGAMADPMIRNAQEQRQLAAIGRWLSARGYVEKSHSSDKPLTEMEEGTYSFRQNLVVLTPKEVNMPIDAVVQPMRRTSQMPVLIEAKSAGDFTNTNKRRKEEATKLRQLRDTYGSGVNLLLFLNGYFDAGYLGYEAAEGLDWVWEHRINDLEQAGL